jgi:hypothetical protein
MFICQPFNGAMSHLLPLSQGSSHGSELMLTNLDRVSCQFVAERCDASHRAHGDHPYLKVAAVFAAILAFMNRYEFVAWNKLDYPSAAPIQNPVR